MLIAQVLRWMDNISMDKWTRAFLEGRRWSQMTTNFVESVNPVFKGIQNLPITMLVGTTYYKMGDLSANRILKCVRR